MKVFVSYSATTESAAYVHRFCERLNDALATRLGDKSRHVFADSSLAIGDNWQVQLAQRLDEADVFVPLYAPLLFNSPPSGQELGYFLARLPPAALEAPIVPVWWAPTLVLDANGFPVPPNTGLALVDGLQHRSKEVVAFGSRDSHELARQGLGYLVPNEANIEFKPLLDHGINQLAERIAQQGQKHAGLLQPAGLKFALAPDVWGLARRAAAPTPPWVPAPGSGGSRVHFIVLAARPDEIGGAPWAIGDLAQAYLDAGGRDWRPFWPDNRYIGNYLQRIVLQNFPDAEPVVVAERDVDAALAAAEQVERRNQPLFFVLDAWTARLADCAHFVQQLSAKLLPYSAVIVPFVGAGQHPDVLENLFGLLQNRDAVDDEVLRTHVVSNEAELGQAITELHDLIRARYRKRAQGLRRPFTGGAKPALSSVPGVPGLPR